MGLDLGSRELDESDKINNNYSNTDFADKYIKKGKTVAKTKAKNRPQKPEIEGIK
jgi:hypothetical protein